MEERLRQLVWSRDAPVLGRAGLPTILPKRYLLLAVRTNLRRNKSNPMATVFSSKYKGLSVFAVEGPWVGVVSLMIDGRPR